MLLNMSSNANSDTKQGALLEGCNGSNNMCLELALEGERLCKAGDCRAGVAFFQAAIQAGTDDLRTLSAIYSQMGNAYFYLTDYEKAMQYHKYDLTLARTMGDKSGEAKASGNLGNTLKVMGHFDEAVACCKHHLELAKELEDQVSEGRALYNLGNIFHAKGKHKLRNRVKKQESDDESPLWEAVDYYEKNLTLMRSLGDVAAQGRACGNLGNTFYLLGDFNQAVRYHGERSSIARQFGDKAAERRAHNNLGNSYIFLGQFTEAKRHYERTLELAQELNDCVVEAQACYSLGNTCTLLKNYDGAVEFHLRHLFIAQNLADRVGEGRACWSLSNAYASLGSYEKALEFAKQHLEISQEISDTMGEVTAKINITDLEKIVSENTFEQNSSISGSYINKKNDNNSTESTPQKCSNRIRRESMGHLNLIKMTPNAKQTNTQSPSKLKTDKESFLDVISEFQSKRLDDQRSDLNFKSKSMVKKNMNEADNLINMIAGIQSKRMDEQRATLPKISTGSQMQSRENVKSTESSNAPDEEFLDELFTCQSARMDDQRASISQFNQKNGAVSSVSKASTVPDEDFFSLIMRLQSGRMDNQRANINLAPKTQNQK